MQKPKVIFIIPAYNEENTIYKVVSDLKNLADILVVDDGSSDNTLNLAKEAGAQTIKNEKNSGYDKTILKGILEAFKLGYDYGITFDADGQHTLLSATSFIEAIYKNHPTVIIGNRNKKARLTEFLAGLYFKMNFNISDPLCGMKGYRLKEVTPLIPTIKHPTIGMGLTYLILKIKNNIHIEQNIEIMDRIDTPRFGNIIKANWKILKGLYYTTRLN